MERRENATYTFGRYRLDSGERRLTRDGQAIPLTPKAFDTLLALVQHAGHALTKDELMRAVWPDGFVEEVNLAYNISILRKALSDGRPGKAYIETVPKLGYRFVAPVQVQGFPSPFSPPHPTSDGTFGDLLNRHLHRKHGLSQSKLAAGILQPPAVISKMCKGQRLTGPQARERVLAIIGWLRQQGALEMVAEANALLTAAGMASLRQAEPVELALIRQLHTSPAELPVTLLVVRRTNLPAQLTRFIGRERELAEVVRVIGEKRLVTLTGAAGMGKTRLALQVGAHMMAQFPDGVWLAELAPLADEALVPAAVAAALGLSEQPGRSLLEALTTVIAEKHMLVILDNCEHVIEASARLTDALLRTCPRLHILATSREALRLAGEVTWRVPPLSTPDPDDVPQMNRAADFDAVQLFVEHAALAQPGFTLTPNDLATVGRICQQLDGMPLAIEMAAAQIAFIGLSGVAAGLDDRLELLVNGSRAALPHHQTLRATLDWSYYLLTEDERTLLARLSVFAGGWSKGAAQAVCESTHHTLLQLVRKSLVMTIVNERDGQPRYRLLETIRDYAAEKLHESGETEAVHDHHLAYFLGIAEATMDLGGPRVEAVSRCLEAEYDNARAAFAWAMTRKDAGEMALRLAGGLRPFWFARGHVVEGQTWVDQALARGDAAPAAARARALLAKTSLCFAQGQVKQALAYAQTSLTLLQASADSLGMAWCKEALANNLFNVRVQALAEEALGTFREFGSRDGEGRALRALGIAALRSGDHMRAAELLEQSIATARWGVMSCLGYLYDVHPERAMDVCVQERERLIQAGNAELVASVLTVQSSLFTAKGDYAQARQSLEESVRWWLQVDAALKQRWDIPSDLRPSECAELSLATWVFDRNYFHYTLLSLGLVEIFLGDTARARVWLDQVRKFAREASNVLVDVAAQLLMVCASIDQQDITVTEIDSLACLQRFHRLGYQSGVVCSLIQVAEVARRQENMCRVSILLGVAGAFVKEIDVLPLWLNRLPSLWYHHAQRVIITPTLAAARTALGDAEFEAAYAEGQRMTLDEAVAYALSDRSRQ